ncbi:DUF5906 domain-containing protein [uncultured Desulfobacter sp.]|uniref:phage NrS-1 polymerase family protein n=1 Tax=uncultured Desulfobacter sp. TaxID=240139 RepID=UPI002AA69C24|nr:DUF5906 domain-containing protein [uncultured Desulfobacter sp.]
MKTFKFGARQDPAVKTDPSAELEEEAQVQNTTNTTMCQPRWLRPELAGIPDELKALPRWVLWGKSSMPAGKEKTPFQPSGIPASSKDPTTWSQYDQVILPYYRGGYAGIGFVIAQNDPYIGIDLDKCRDKTTGALDPWALEHLTTLASYTEVSPSGTGTHTIIKGSLPDGHACRKKGIEIYSADRYLTVTGHRLPGIPASIEERPEQIAEVHKRVFGDAAANGAPAAAWTYAACEGWSGPDNDDDLLEMARKRHSVRAIIGAGATFRQLWDADEDALGKYFPDVAGGQSRTFDWSQADAALCAHLAYWTGRNCDRMRELWGRSELAQRNKFLNRQDYVESTILSACGLVKEVYQDRRLTINDDGSDPYTAGLSLNDTHAMVNVSGQASILHQTVDPTTGEPKDEFQTIASFKALNDNRRVIAMVNRGYSEEPKSVTIAEAFLKNPNRRQYDGVVFDPTKTRVPGEKYYNLWAGLSVKPKKGDWSLMRDLILNVISAGDKEICEWLYAWIARIIQEPGGKRPGTAPVLRGKMGTGKGKFMEYLGKIFGQHYYHVTSPDRVFKNFNAPLQNRVLVYVDEAFWAGNKKYEGALRALITEDTLDIEHKGVNCFTIRNHINWVFATNNSWAVPAGLEERRFFVIDVADIHMQDSKKGGYFDLLSRQMETGGTEAMLYDLLRHDWRQVDLRRFKHTKALLENKVRTMNTAKKFWYECLLEGEMPVTGEGRPPWGQISKDGLFDAYVRFADKIRGGDPGPNSQFAKEIRSLSPSVSETRPAAPPGGERPRFWQFKDLATCRAEFETLVRGKIDWPE